MDFKTLFSIMNKYLSDGDGIPAFFRELMAMITTVTEAEWGTATDPSSRLSDNTIRSYVKRGLPKKFAKNIVYHLTPDVLARKINKRSSEVKQLLAEDLHGYNPTIDADSVAKAISALLVEIIQASAGLVPQSELQKQQQQKLSSDLKGKYGDYLLNESCGICAFPGCGKQLSVSRNGQVIPIYEVSLVDKTNPAEPDNLLAMCPQCYATYLLDDSKKFSKQLSAVKRTLSAHKESIRLLDDLPLEKGLTNVIRKIKSLGETGLSDASLDPKEIKHKISPEKEWNLYTIVNTYVTTYYTRIAEIMVNLDKRGELDYDALQDQIHALYKKLKKVKKSQMEIFSEITDRLHRATLGDTVYCQIIVAYFVQKCEVFDAITE